MSSVLPDREPVTNTGITLPNSLKKRLEEIAEQKGYSRNEVIILFLTWALRAHEEEEAAKKSGGKKGH